ncbi:MAG: hypothetical protein LBL66_06070 [Clostridiales bacterium]|jgi:hypothetical protein|nr:hypothetical protein [Clostridiales bacterium]
MLKTKKATRLSAVLLAAVLLFSACVKLAPDTTPTVSPAEQRYTVGSSADPVFTIDLKSEAVLRVTADGATLAPENYDVSDTSLAVKRAYLDTLAEGRYGFTLVTNGGEAAFAVVVTAAPVKNMTAAEYTAALGKDEYTVSGLTGAYGLKDGGNVGVDREYYKETMYPAKADSAFDGDALIVFDSQTGTNDTQKWVASLAAAKAVNQPAAGEGKEVKIKLPDRELDLDWSNAASEAAGKAYLTGYKGLYIEGGPNTVLMLDMLAGWVLGFSVSDSEDVHFNHVRLDMKYSTTMAGIFENAADADAANLTVKLRIPDSFAPELDALDKNPDLYADLYSIVEYDQYTRAPKKDGVAIFTWGGSDAYHTSRAHKIETDGATGNTYITIKFKDSYRNLFKVPRVNDRFALAFTSYGPVSIGLSNSENIYFEDCAIYNGTGMAIAAGDVENLYVNRFDITLKKDRLMTITSDCFHLIGVTGDLKITNSVFENSHDDGLNILAGFYYNLQSWNATERKIVITRRTEGIMTPRVDDILEAYDADTFEYKMDFKVVAVEGDAASYTITVASRIPGTVDLKNSVITNVSYTPALLFKNNIVRNKRNRGILLQVRNSVIENNAFMNVGNGAIMMSTQLDRFNEATIPDNSVIRNNKFINNGYLSLAQGTIDGDVSIFALAQNAVVAPTGTVKNMVVENNFMSYSGVAAVSFRGVSQSVINNNLFHNATRSVLELNNAEDIDVNGNYNYYTLEDGNDFLEIRSAGTTDQSKIYLQGNSNLAFPDLSGDNPEVRVAKIPSGTVTIDGYVSEWGDAVGTDVPMRGASFADGTVAEPNVYKPFFDVLLCKVGWTDEGLVMAFKVFDDYRDPHTMLDFWTGDCVEIFMTTYTDKPGADFEVFRNQPGEDIFQAVFSPADTWASTGYWDFWGRRTNDATRAAKSSWQVAMRYTGSAPDGSFEGEIFIPFTAIPKVASLAGTESPVAMSFTFGDHERADKGLTRLEVASLPHFIADWKVCPAKKQRFIFEE